MIHGFGPAPDMVGPLTGDCPELHAAIARHFQGRLDKGRVRNQWDGGA